MPYAQAGELLDIGDVCNSCQVHEDDEAKVVVVCEPGLQKSMGALHPAAALYERFVNIESSISEHAAFRNTLRDKGIKVLTVREILRHGLENLRCRIDLEDLAMEMLTYKADSSHSGSGESAPPLSLPLPPLSHSTDPPRFSLPYGMGGQWRSPRRQRRRPRWTGASATTSRTSTSGRFWRTWAPTSSSMLF